MAREEKDKSGYERMMEEVQKVEWYCGGQYKEWLKEEQEKAENVEQAMEGVRRMLSDSFAPLHQAEEALKHYREVIWELRMWSDCVERDIEEVWDILWNALNKVSLFVVEGERWDKVKGEVINALMRLKDYDRYSVEYYLDRMGKEVVRLVEWYEKLRSSILRVLQARDKVLREAVTRGKSVG